MSAKKDSDIDDTHPTRLQVGHSPDNHVQLPFMENRVLQSMEYEESGSSDLSRAVSDLYVRNEPRYAFVQAYSGTRFGGTQIGDTWAGDTIFDFFGFQRAAVGTSNESYTRAPKPQEGQAGRHAQPSVTIKQQEEEEIECLPSESFELDSTPPNPPDYRSTHEINREFRFEYQPLPSEPKMIRIIKLLPGSRTDHLEVILERTSIDSAEPYQAISYVWGAKEDVANIFCQGKSLEIPLNLYDVLLELRCRSKPKRLWADAICINQQCDAEKSLQIPLMRVIFGRAENVLIWLGRFGATLAEHAFGFARRVSEKDFENLIQDENIWKLFSVLFSQRWFWRIWCFQEVVLARKAEVMWGEARIDWEPLGRTATWIARTGYEVLQRFPLPGAYNASLMYSMSRGVTDSVPRSFLRLLMLTRQFDCTKSEDHIYGLLGIKTADADPDQDIFFMKPSYEMTKEAVYEEFAVKVIETSQDMTLLSAVQHGPHLSTDTKSWVPQWDKNYTRSIASAGFLHISFSASLHLEKSPPSLHNSNLVVHGLEVDAIARVSETMPGKDRFPSEHWRIQDLWTTMTASLASCPDDLDLATSFCWTLTAGKDWLGNSVQDEDSHFADFAAFVHQNFTLKTRESPKISAILTRENESEKGEAGRYTEALYCCFGMRRFFVTKKGYIGIGPACMQEGDKVSVLSGAIVPFIVRPDGVEHKLVGEAYVHGIMHGEACELHGNGSMELSTFCFT